MNFNIQQNITGENLINKLTVNELNNLLPQLQKYVGTKILTQSGKSAKLKYEHTKENNFRAHLDISTYSIWLKCDVSTQSAPDKNDVCTTTYFKRDIYLGEMKNDGTLKSLEDLNIILINWSLTNVIELEKVNEQIKKYKELKQQIEAIENNFQLNKNFLKY